MKRKIEDFLVNKEKSIINWVYDKKSYSNDAINLDQVMVDHNRQLIFILKGEGVLPDKLEILNHFGALVFSSSPPMGASFYYLTKVSTNEVMIICAFEKKIDGWNDWHYSFDENKVVLSRASPSY